MSPIKLLHCSSTREDHGGIQSVLVHHHASDAQMGFAARFLGYFDPAVTWRGDCATLAGRGGERVGTLRRRFAAVAGSRPADIVIYHDGWGLDWFAPLDRAARRVVFLHTEWPHADELLRTHGPWVDGFLSVSRAYADRVRRVLPDFPADRIRALPYFVDPPPDLSGGGGVTRGPGPLRLGYAGRIVAAHKRLDRLPALIAELDRQRVDYQFELAGEGDLRTSLQRRLAAHPRVRFLGWQRGDAYWRALAGWDAQVFFSDYEGLSRAGMEGMLSGAMLIYPDFSAAAAELLGPQAAIGLYPVGDMVAAAQRIAALAAMDRAERSRLAVASCQHLAGHTPAHYNAAYREFLHGIMDRPAIARPQPPPVWHDWMPLGVYTRMFPQRF